MSYHSVEIDIHKPLNLNKLIVELKDELCKSFTDLLTKGNWWTNRSPKKKEQMVDKPQTFVHQRKSPSRWQPKAYQRLLYCVTSV